MSNLQRQAADALASAINASIKLVEPPQVIDANPSEVADYPRVAVSMERFPLTLHSEEELMVGEDGEPLMGARATLLELPAGPARVDSKHRLSKIGSFRGFGRIWVGCRYPVVREEMQYSITCAFAQDTSAIGRILAPIFKPRIGALELPWSWTAAFFIEEQSWVDEHAFEERVWGFTNFDVELDILVLRSSPMVSQLRLALNTHFQPPGSAEEIVIPSDAFP